MTARPPLLGPDSLIGVELDDALEGGMNVDWLGSSNAVTLDAVDRCLGQDELARKTLDRLLRRRQSLKRGAKPLPSEERAARQTWLARGDAAVAQWRAEADASEPIRLRRARQRWRRRQTHVDCDRVRQTHVDCDHTLDAVSEPAPTGRLGYDRYVLVFEGRSR